MVILSIWTITILESNYLFSGSGDLVSAWEPKKERPTLYFEDEQLDEVVSFLFGIIRETPRARQLKVTAYSFLIMLYIIS